MKNEIQIKQALKDSEEYFKKLYPDKKPESPELKLRSMVELARDIKALAVANEICTLKWVLGKGKLNCYAKKEDK